MTNEMMMMHRSSCKIAKYGKSSKPTRNWGENRKFNLHCKCERYHGALGA